MHKWGDDMRLERSPLTLAGVPALLVHRGPREAALRRGVVLFFHGLGGSKEVNARDLEVFAGQGLCAVGLDAVGQGERRFPDFDARFAPGNPRLEEEFLRIVQATAEEVPAVFDALVALGADAQRLGLSGVSQGAFICYRAVLLDRRVRAVAALLGSPEWALPWPDSPHLHPERFFPVALFSQTAGRDQVVSPLGARIFHQRLAPHYSRAPERLLYREFPLSGHMMWPEDWDEALQDAASWLVRFLSG